MVFLRNIQRGYNIGKVSIDTLIPRWIPTDLGTRSLAEATQLDKNPTYD